MCGIAGIIHFDKKQVPLAKLRKMASFLRERGPDHEGFWMEAHVGFAHTRLSIIDLSSNANQPMLCASISVIVTYNGEIYNFREMKKDLQKQGYKFFSDSDTEVICIGYKAWGMEKLLEKLEGMFSFALYDQDANTVFLVRDTFGKKPLYWLKRNDKVLFSSDIRSIWALEKDHLTLNYAALDYYLTEISVPQPMTIWNEIRQVPPASFCHIDIGSSTIGTFKYWDVNDIKISDSMTFEEALNRTEECLTRAVLKRTVVDVPIGCFLSGGVDSGLVTAILASNSKEQISTYSVGFKDYEGSELAAAKEIARKYDTDHDEIMVESDMVTTLPDLIEYSGEPFADASLIPTYYITKYLSQDVKAALSGDGGDEMFGGYDDYLVAYKASMLAQKYPNPWLRNAVVLVDKLWYRINRNNENLGWFNEYLQLDAATKLYRNIGFSFDSKHQLFNQSFPEGFRGAAKKILYEKWGNTKGVISIVDRLMRTSLQTRLLNNYLVKIDRASMKNSLEVMSPFLDRQLAELAFSIPYQHKFHTGKSKYILRSIASRYISPAMINRKKHGFGMPTTKWISDNEKYFKEIIYQGKFEDVGLDSQRIKTMWSNSSEKKTEMWSLICLAIWLEKYY